MGINHATNCKKFAWSDDTVQFLKLFCKAPTKYNVVELYLIAILVLNTVLSKGQKLILLILLRDLKTKSILGNSIRQILPYVCNGCQE